MAKSCACLSRRQAALIAGVFNTVVGTAAIMTLVLLFTLVDKAVLWPETDDDRARRQSLGRILVFYVPPCVFAYILGILMTLAGIKNDRQLSEISFLLSTCFVCGLGVELVSMKIYGASWKTMWPLLLLLGVEILIFIVSADFRDHILNHGRIVKSSTDRKRLRDHEETINIHHVINDPEELSHFNIRQSFDSANSESDPLK